MCGIIYAKGNKDVRAAALARYEAQKGRGQEGFGFVALNQGSISSYERAEDEETIKAKLEAVPCDELLFHHRYPTSTPNFMEAAHPIKVSHESMKHDYYVVHNGIITDDVDWKIKHEEEGYKYTTEMVAGYLVGGKVRQAKAEWNDSEALAIELALDLEANGGGVQVSGSIAFICLVVDKATNKATRLVWGRNGGQPLNFFCLPDTLFTICSEGLGDLCRPHTIYSYDYTTFAFAEKKYQVGHWGRDYDGEIESPITALEIRNEEPTAYPQMPDSYYLFIENKEELIKEIRIAEEAGEDTTELSNELDMVEDRIREMEEIHDKIVANIEF